MIHDQHLGPRSDPFNKISVSLHPPYLEQSEWEKSNDTRGSMGNRTLVAAYPQVVASVYSRSKAAMTREKRQ